MVANIERGHISSIKIIEGVLETAKVPQYWYRISKPIEDTACITKEKDGIHVFIYERGRRKSESTHKTWYKAILAFSRYIDLECANTLICTANNIVQKRAEARKEEEQKRNSNIIRLPVNSGVNILPMRSHHYVAAKKSHRVTATKPSHSIAGKVAAKALPARGKAAHSAKAAKKAETRASNKPAKTRIKSPKR